jgi:hypothetical protein
VQGEPVASTDRSIHDPEMLTTVDSTSPAHGEDDNEDSEAISPPGSTEVDDVDDGAFEAVAEYDDFRHPLSLENGEEDIVGKAIEEYREEGEDMDMDVNAIGGFDAGVVSL